MWIGFATLKPENCERKEEVWLEEETRVEGRLSDLLLNHPKCSTRENILKACFKIEMNKFLALEPESSWKAH